MKPGPVHPGELTGLTQCLATSGVEEADTEPGFQNLQGRHHLPPRRAHQLRGEEVVAHGLARGPELRAARHLGGVHASETAAGDLVQIDGEPVVLSAQNQLRDVLLGEGAKSAEEVLVSSTLPLFAGEGRGLHDVLAVEARAAAARHIALGDRGFCVSSGEILHELDRGVRPQSRVDESPDTLLHRERVRGDGFVAVLGGVRHIRQISGTVDAKWGLPAVCWLQRAVSQEVSVTPRSERIASRRSWSKARAASTRERTADSESPSRTELCSRRLRMP